MHFNMQAFTTLKWFAFQELIIPAKWSVDNSPKFWQKDENTHMPCIIYYPDEVLAGCWQLVRAYGYQIEPWQAWDIKDLFQLYEALVEVNPKILKLIADPSFQPLSA
jgi:hypothetical protein